MLKRIFNRIIPVIISALGGAMMVFSSYDDSPGGSLLGLMLIVLAATIAIKTKTAKL